MVFTEKDKIIEDGISFTTNTSGDTWCYLTYKGKQFVGHTKCHPEDQDFWSERVGCFIAEHRAIIKKFKFMKKELLPNLQVLENLEKQLKCCKQYNPDSFEAKRLRKEIYLQRSKINELNEAIKDEQDYLKQYIYGKDKLYNRLRTRAKATK